MQFICNQQPKIKLLTGQVLPTRRSIPVENADPHCVGYHSQHNINPPGSDVLLMLQDQLEQGGCAVGPSEGGELGKGNQGSGVAHQLNNQSMDELNNQPMDELNNQSMDELNNQSMDELNNQSMDESRPSVANNLGHSQMNKTEWNQRE